MNPRRMLIDEQEQATPHLTVLDPPKVEVPKMTPVTPVADVFKGVSFGAIKSAKKEGSGRKSYPLFPDADGSAAALAACIVEMYEQVEKFESAKAMLAEAVTPFYFSNASGKADVPSSVEVASEKGTVLVTFQNRYRNATDPGLIVSLVGPEKVGRYFKQGFALKVDGDKVPEQHAQALIDELQQVFVKYGAVEALSVSQSIKPLPTFHAARHLELTPQQNEKIDGACTVVKVVKPAAGRKSGRLDPSKA